MEPFKIHNYTNAKTKPAKPEKPNALKSTTPSERYYDTATDSEIEGQISRLVIRSCL